jgi:dTDP-4-dehydrorhamnose reductase
MKILIIGAAGQLGSYLCSYLAKGHEIVESRRQDLCLFDLVKVPDAIRDIKPDLIINCAAYTNVDKAENDRLRCGRVNITAPASISNICKADNIRFIQYSTDYVFHQGGSVPYKENHAKLAFGVYAESKDTMERRLQDDQNTLIIRTCGLYSKTGNNFMNTMLGLIDKPEITVVNDQICTPTYIPDLAEATKNLIEAEASGIYHFTNSGSCTWYEFAVEIFKRIGRGPVVKPITTAEYRESRSPLKIAPRPSYSVLDCGKYKVKCGKGIPGWQTTLWRCLNELHPRGSGTADVRGSEQSPPGGCEDTV